MAYIYQADTWCDECGDAIKVRIRREHPELVPEDWMDLASYDSDDYPKPYDERRDQSDSPQHCAGCHEFMCNPLTSAGYRYVQETLNESGTPLSECAAEWAAHYGFSYWDAEDIQYTNKPQPGWYPA